MACSVQPQSLFNRSSCSNSNSNTDTKVTTKWCKAVLEHYHGSEHFPSLLYFGQ